MFRARVSFIILALSNAGCGVSILASYPAEMPFLRMHNETVREVSRSQFVVKSVSSVPPAYAYATR